MYFNFYIVMYFKIYCVFLFLVLMFDAESALDCKKIFITFSLLILIMLVVAEPIGIVVSLGLLPFNMI